MLISYLREHFFNETELLNFSGVSKKELLKFQKTAKMPKASYVLKQEIQCISFFGNHNQTIKQHYYAKSYVFWLGLLCNHNLDAFSYFKDQYIKTLNALYIKITSIKSNAFNNNVDELIEDEWKHFLDGTYGLCTSSGLPEDIAKKEYAITLINELTDNLNKSTLPTDKKHLLLQAVTQMDQATSKFAPHERNISSRKKYITDIICKYQL